MHLNHFTDLELYGTHESPSLSPVTHISLLSPDAIISLTSDQMRSIIYVLFSIGNQNSTESHRIPPSFPAYITTPCVSTEH